MCIMDSDIDESVKLGNQCFAEGWNSGSEGQAACLASKALATRLVAGRAIAIVRLGLRLDLCSFSRTPIDLRTTNP